jgi:hypothetical protein
MLLLEKSGIKHDTNCYVIAVIAVIGKLSRIILGIISYFMAVIIGKKSGIKHGTKSYIMAAVIGK